MIKHREEISSLAVIAATARTNHSKDARLTCSAIFADTIKALLATFAMAKLVCTASGDSTWTYTGNVMQGCNCAIDGTMTVNDGATFMLNYDFTAGPYTMTPANSSVGNVQQNGSNNFNFGIAGISGNVKGVSLITFEPSGSGGFDGIQSNFNFTSMNHNPGTWTLDSVVTPPPAVSVTLQPTFFQGANATIGATFKWNTVTQTLFDFNVTATGTATGFSNTPLTEVFGPDGITILAFRNSNGDIFELNYENHAGLLFPLLEDVPGTYQTDMDLLCSGKDACLGGDWFQRDGNAGEAVVSAVSTPEPGTLALVSVGLIGLLARKRKAHRTPIAAQT
jgi:PEP-CTERM motif